MRIARGDNAVVGEQHDGEGPTDLAECVNDPGEQCIGPRMSNQVNDHLAVRRGLENGAVRFEFIAKHLRINEIPVVRQCEIPEGEIDGERLNVLEILASGGRVAIVADGHRSCEVLEGLIIVDVRDQSHTLM